MPPLRCPACRNIALKAQTDPVTRLEIDSCPSCRGLWFDAHELQRFLKSDNLKTRFMWSEAVEPLASVGYVINTTRRTCPRCKVAMAEKLYAGVTLDFCNQCEGLWFDDGEVRLIVERYKQGARTGDNAVVGELKQGLSTGKDGLHTGLFASLMEFVRGMRQ